MLYNICVYSNLHPNQVLGESIARTDSSLSILNKWDTHTLNHVFLFKQLQAYRTYCEVYNMVTEEKQPIGQQEK